jgi:hypothetical protein
MNQNEVIYEDEDENLILSTRNSNTIHRDNPILQGLLNPRDSHLLTQDNQPTH